VRAGIVVLAAACAGAPAAQAHLLDHPAPPFGSPTAPPQVASSGGPNAKWEFLATVPTGNPHTDLEFFTRGGNTYASVGTLGIGANGGGQTIVQLTQGPLVAPKLVGNFPSASCVSNPNAALGLQHDVEAAPKGSTILNTDVRAADRRETQIIVDATDAEGRCHDQGTSLGFNPPAPAPQIAPQGGLEIVDVSDPAHPVALGLTSHIGEAHTVNIDPKRPHIAYAVTSDGVSVNAEGKRGNETAGASALGLDGFEVVDMSSCMNFPAGTSLDAKRTACRPQVYRYRYPTTDMALGHTNKGTLYACHELEVYPDDRLTCASGQAMVLLDMTEAFDDRGTPADYSDDKPRGRPLPCQVRESSSNEPFGTGARITDCVDGQGTGTDDLHVDKWLAAGAPSLTGVRWRGSAFHPGRESTTGAAQPKFDSTQDVDFDHEAELTASGRYVLATDERGGGVAPPGASCSPSVDNKTGNGGIHAYRVDGLLSRRPTSAQDAHSSYARTSKGEKAIFRAEIRTKPQGSLCTAHVFQQIPGQNRIFMGWYSQGTRVIDFTENANGTIDFREAGYFIPTNGNNWVSHVFKLEHNADGSYSYYGATGDFAVGDGGRNAIDVWKVTLPPPPAPRGGPLPGTGRGFAPSGRCVPNRGKVGSRGLGRLRIGDTRARVLRRFGFASKAQGRIWTYCVTGSRGRGKVVAMFAPGRNGRLRLVATNWRGHKARRVAPGSRTTALSRSFPRRRGLGFGLSLAHRTSRVLFVTRAGRVRYIAAVDRKLARGRVLLRGELRRARVR
jgi:hypothetical protein